MKSKLKCFPSFSFLPLRPPPPHLFKLPQEGLIYMKLAGSSVTQFIVFILSFWQPSVIPDVISLTTRKNSY